MDFQATAAIAFLRYHGWSHASVVQHPGHSGRLLASSLRVAGEMAGMILNPPVELSAAPGGATAAAALHGPDGLILRRGDP